MDTKNERLNRDDWQHLITAVGLLGGVLGTILLGAMLRVEATPEDGMPVSRSGQADPIAATTSRPMSNPNPGETSGRADTMQPQSNTTTQEPAPRRLQPQTVVAPSTAADDSRRLLRTGAQWTLQFMVTCKQESAQRIQEQVDHDPRLYLLPVDVDGRDCLRICWNGFTSRDAAVSDDEIPGPLQTLNPEPIPRRIDDLVP